MRAGEANRFFDSDHNGNVMDNVLNTDEIAIEAAQTVGAVHTTSEARRRLVEGEG